MARVQFRALCFGVSSGEGAAENVPGSARCKTEIKTTTGPIVFACVHIGGLHRRAVRSG